MENLAASLFSLIKNNGGLFKSEKQAAFLNSKAYDGVIISNQSFHFGEYDARTSRNTANVRFEFFLSNDKIEQVNKTTKSGTVVYWKFDASKVEECQALAAKRKAEKEAAVEAQRIKDQAENAELLATYKAKLKDLEECQTECLDFLKSKGEGCKEPETERALRALICFMDEIVVLKKLISNLTN